MSAVVTTQPCIVPVDNKARAAPRTHRFPAARRAQQRRREAAPVDEKQGLLVLRETSRNRLLQHRRDAFDVAPIPTAYQAHGGKAAMRGCAPWQFEP